MYRFWLDIPGQGLVQAYPFNSQLRWVDKRKTGYRFYQRTLETKLILKDDPKNSIFDFTNLFNLERQGLTCTKVPITIDKYCDCDESWTEGFYTGYIRLNQCDWDVSDCTVDVPIVVQDPYTCLTSSWTNDINMFDYGDPVVTIDPFYGAIVQATCEYSHTFEFDGIPSFSHLKQTVSAYFWAHYADDCIEQDQGWTKIKHTFYISEFNFNPPFFGIGNGSTIVTIQVRTQYAREFSLDLTEPPGDGWISLGAGWARPIATLPLEYFTTETEEGRALVYEEWDIDSTQFGIYGRYRIVGLNENGTSIFTNGKALNALIEDLAAQCDLTVVSDFLNINPDNTHPDNEYYDNAEVDAHGLHIFQITDVARLDESQSATIGLIQFKKIIDALKIAFNLDVEIVNGNTLRIEHLSFWPNTVNIDLTQAEFLYLIESKWKYTYDQESQPKNEVFGWDHETDGKGNDFDGFPISYDNDCVNDVENKQDRVLLASGFLTNPYFITGNEDYFDSTDLFVLVSSTDGILNSATQPISGLSKLNGNLAFGYLLPRYYPYGRPFKMGQINQTDTPFFAILRNRLQAPITIPFSCDNYMGDYNPAELVKTQLGACEIETATYVDPEQQMEFKLRAK